MGRPSDITSARESAEALRDMLVNWTLDHISVKDKRIAETLNSFGGPLRK
jgi:hemerythrin